MAQKEIHGGADDREVAGGRTPVQPRQHDCRGSQAGRDDRANLLPLVKGIWRHEHNRCQADEGTGEGERPLEAACGRGGVGETGEGFRQQSQTPQQLGRPSAGPAKHPSNGLRSKTPSASPFKGGEPAARHERAARALARSRHPLLQCGQA